MKKSISLVALALVASSFLSSCKKNQCETCDYYKGGVDTELGEYCGDDLENIEKNGYTDSTGTTYEVHCGAH